ncbi:BQ2448_5758 [Microbotryum intermedium]|uniref:DNA-directed RNA polymerase III subunit RPC3 n=1 Tax=Microbotryum intermedium TaxID=269621 RepID=A0A238EZ45_9BASI|nr:BQ2448_5758 [Microbotryum intermedium]
MGQDRIRLLTDIVNQHFGSVVGEIASILLARGSLTFAHLTRLSSLPSALIHQALLVLSLHTLLYHSEIDSEKRVEAFEINQANLEQRLRGGLYIDLANRKAQSLSLSPSLDSVLTKIVQEIWKNGMMGTHDLVAFAKQEILLQHRMLVIKHELAAEASASSNGAVDPSSSLSKLKGKGKARGLGPLSDARAEARAQVLCKRAFHDGYLALITPESQEMPRSLEIKWDTEARQGMKSILSAKEAKEVKEKIQARKDTHLEEQKARSKNMTVEELEDSYRVRKKTKPYHENDLDDIESVEGMKDLPVSFVSVMCMHRTCSALKRAPLIPQNGATFRVNAERLHTVWRSEMMERFASEIYNPHIGRVFRLVLDVADASLYSMEDQESRPINCNELLKAWSALPKSERVTLRHAFNDDPCLDPKWGSLYDKEDADLMVEILHILAKVDDLGVNAASGFLRQSGGEGPGAKWSVRYKDLGDRLKRALVEAMVEDKLDKKAIKCWRILDAKGKLDEKHLARLAFLTVKEARETIARLRAMSFIESQEVPRSADRAPARTFYLWYVDYPKVVRTLLDHQYKALANLQVQKTQLMERSSKVLEKSERTDVREDPKLMDSRDKQLLDELEKLMEALIVAEMRIDSQVFILKDFA